MKKYLLILLASGLLAACNNNQNATQNEEAEAATTEKTAASDTNTSEESSPMKKNKKDTPSTNSATPTPDSPSSPNSLTDTEKKFLRIPTVSIETPYGEDGNIAYEHTQKEIVDEYMDEDGRIYFPLDEKPIRTIVSGENENIRNITNYGDAFIGIVEEEAYELTDQDQIDEAYQLILRATPAQLQSQELTYRTYEEATNLERGITKITYLIAPTLGDLDYIVQTQAYDHEALPILLEELESLGSPTLLPPAPQTAMDLQLFESMQIVQAMWGRIGQFENPKTNRAEFEQLYLEVRKETLNMMARVNYTLSEEI
ncbi:hypothetical protein GLW07_13935 [Bacillus hwajinpoensis]|uniref:Uncharacterized protein n=1 Tax=Guptibacillus hwajinpoensis TaxID=208199 RepID=A0A845F0R9_9BACL|nr:hypothetical protein [Pseudalkalibacillus hwajinpoensis]MYL64453.1 hypothetical protein [Pseudalkalibacillus hwajinpoensis]